jgi:hypothetical protein
MGGLSKDPAKAQRQREALAAGRRKMAENLVNGAKPKPAAKAKPKPAAKAPAKASKGSRRDDGDPDRLRYDRSPKRAPKSASSRDRRDDRPPKRGGFLAGLRGQLD